MLPASYLRGEEEVAVRALVGPGGPGVLHLLAVAPVFGMSRAGKWWVDGWVGRQSCSEEGQATKQADLC